MNISGSEALTSTSSKLAPNTLIRLNNANMQSV